MGSDGGQATFRETALSSAQLEDMFRALAPLLANPVPRPPRTVFSLSELELAFKEIEGPLAYAKMQGGLVNPWALAGLKRDEVRIAATLAGLWSADFGGAASCGFLIEYLARAIPGIDWRAELFEGYRVETESNPLGDTADRVDIMIETRGHVIGVEVKIDAPLGPQQLERYRAAIDRRSMLHSRHPHALLLARFVPASTDTHATSWRTVATAAACAVPGRTADRSFTENLIASFGDYVRSF